MLEVRLHGALAKEFGMVWNLDVRSAPEAVDIIDANRPGFRRRIMELAHKGYVYRVRTKDHDYDNDDVQMALGSAKRLDITPVVMGAGAGLRFVIGAVLVVVGLYSETPALVAAGASMMMGSISEWLTPKAKKDSSASGLQSWGISGATNTVDQGYPVPIIYGEVLTGSYVISAGISISQLHNGSGDPSVEIGGDFNVSTGTGVGGTFTQVLTLGASAFNLKDPITYSWAVTGFSGAAAVRVTGQNTSAIRIEVDFPPMLDDQSLTFTGSASVSISGVSTNGTATTNTATSSQSLSVNVLTTTYGGNGSGGAP